MKPYVGQEVVVLQAHANGANMNGKVVRQANGTFHGKWWVDLGDTMLPVEEERIVDAKVFYARERAKHEFPPKEGGTS